MLIEDLEIVLLRLRIQKYRSYGLAHAVVDYLNQRNVYLKVKIK